MWSWCRTCSTFDPVQWISLNPIRGSVMGCWPKRLTRLPRTGPLVRPLPSSAERTKGEFAAAETKAAFDWRKPEADGPIKRCQKDRLWPTSLLFRPTFYLRLLLNPHLVVWNFLTLRRSFCYRVNPFGAGFRPFSGFNPTQDVAPIGGGGPGPPRCGVLRVKSVRKVDRHFKPIHMGHRVPETGLF